MVGEADFSVMFRHTGWPMHAEHMTCYSIRFAQPSIPDTTHRIRLRLQQTNQSITLNVQDENDSNLLVESVWRWQWAELILPPLTHHRTQVLCSLKPGLVQNTYRRTISSVSEKFRKYTVVLGTYCWIHFAECVPGLYTMTCLCMYLLWLKRRNQFGIKEGSAIQSFSISRQGYELPMQVAVWAVVLYHDTHRRSLCTFDVNHYRCRTRLKRTARFSSG